MNETLQPTVDALRCEALQRLRTPCGDQAEATVDWALSACLGTSRDQLSLQWGQRTPPPVLARWQEWLKRLEAGEPVQYVTGETDFMDLTLQCDPRALIPRPETEQLVEWILENESLWRKGPVTAADVGTGAGCILLALAHAHSDLQGLGLDGSSKALELAEHNHSHGLPNASCTWRQSHLLEQVGDWTFDLIVANLPYISQADWERLPASVRQFEPRAALTDESDGMQLIRELIRTAPGCLRSSGWLYLEIGEHQGDDVLAEFPSDLYERPEIRKDWSGRFRMVRCQVKT